MFGLEQKLFDQLIRLKENYDLQGIKAEFEAEGSSFRDLVRLRRITDKLNVPLYLKIGDDHSIHARFEAGRSKEDKISAVHFVRFSVPGTIKTMLQSHGANVAIKITHENYIAEAHVPDVMRKEWVKDLNS